MLAECVFGQAAKSSSGFASPGNLYWPLRRRLYRIERPENHACIAKLPRGNPAGDSSERIAEIARFATEYDLVPVDAFDRFVRRE